MEEGARLDDLDDIAHVPVADIDKHLARCVSVALELEHRGIQSAALTELVENARCITFMAKRTLSGQCQQHSQRSTTRTGGR